MDVRKTRGLHLVGASFNPSGREDVDNIKLAAANLIDVIEAVPDGAQFPPDRSWFKREAIKQAVDAAMWGVKAATLDGDNG